MGVTGAAAGVPGSWAVRWPRGLARAGRTAFSSIPPSGLILLGTVSVQVGAGVAKNLFGALPPSAVVTLRLIASAAVLAVMCRSGLRRLFRAHTRRDLAVAGAFGLSLAVMNYSIYEAIARIPLGIAVAIEFLGPLAVAVVGSRRRLDLLWVLLAGTGVMLFGQTDGQGHVTAAGVTFALISATAWAAYIWLSAATGRRFRDSTGLAVASVVAATLVAPMGAHAGGTDLLRPEFLLIGAAVGLLSSVIPYTLELQALRRVSTKTFGIFMSLEPAVAALVGLVLLGEVLLLQEWLAIVLVMLACIGVTRTGDDKTRPADAAQA